MMIPASVLIGVAAWFLVRLFLTGFFTVDPNERAVKTVFGRAQRAGALTTLDTPLGELMRADERERYVYPQVRVIGPGGPYFTILSGHGSASTKFRWRPRRSTWRRISKTQAPIVMARSCKR
jgi:hypothetical protein